MEIRGANPRDHPRMCGEHDGSKTCTINDVGSSPHVRGAHHDTGDGRLRGGIIPACAGSTISIVAALPLIRDHPRMCGEHVEAVICGVLDCGIIPACAGSTATLDGRASPSRDHPRMCGEHWGWTPVKCSLVESSPHVRGALAIVSHYDGDVGIIPACAGSTCFSALVACERRDHPRMCGEHKIVTDDVEAGQGSSPHVRGAPTQK